MFKFIARYLNMREEQVVNRVMEEVARERKDLMDYMVNRMDVLVKSGFRGK